MRALPLAQYGFLATALAFCALPLYVVLPQYAMTQLGISVGVLGGVLLATRLVDAIVDPLLGFWVARWRAWPWYGLTLLVCVWCGAFGAVFLIPAPPIWQFAMLLQVTLLGFSLLSIAYYAWGSTLGVNPAERARVSAWREGWGLVGVLLATGLPAWWVVTTGGYGAMLRVYAVFCTLAVLGLFAWWRMGRAVIQATEPLPRQSFVTLWQEASPNLRCLAGLTLWNGIAISIPATLVLSFVTQHLLLPESQAYPLLFAYFLAGVIGMPLWNYLVGRWGFAATWRIGMLCAVLAFLGALFLRAGDRWPFLSVCLLSGLALGADLLVPPAWLAQILKEQGEAQPARYWGVWQGLNKLALAGGSGLALLLLAGLPGCLPWIYAALPCAMKLAAWFFLRRWQPPVALQSSQAVEAK